MSEMQGIQAEIRHRFHTHVDQVDPRLATVSDYVGEDHYIDYGADQLVLELLPSSPDRCPLRMYVNPSFFEVAVGRHIADVSISYMDRDRPRVSEYPDRAEEFIRAAVYGLVTETEWLWRGRLIYATARIQTQSGVIRRAYSHSSLLGYLRNLLPGVTRLDTSYLPYV